uniref:WH2 domain-containing protein n=1 Tax=Mesocestoides corti TaxID=53468 RepID=A0A5K3F5D8_MESCO
MAFANDTQPVPEKINDTLNGSDLTGPAESNGIKKVKKRKGFSLCGLNCMGRKEKDADLYSSAVSQTLEKGDVGAPTTEVVPPQHLQQVVEPPSQVSPCPTAEEPTGDVDVTAVNVQPLHKEEEPSAETANAQQLLAPVVSQVPTPSPRTQPADIVASPSKPPIPTRVFENSPPTTIETPNKNVDEPDGTTTAPQPSPSKHIGKIISQCDAPLPKPLNTSSSTETTQLAFSTKTHERENIPPSLIIKNEPEDVGCAGPAANGSSSPSLKKPESAIVPSSPGKMSIVSSGGGSPHSGIPLPRNPTRAISSITHNSSSSADAILDSKPSDSSGTFWQPDVTPQSLDPLAESVEPGRKHPNSVAKLPVPETSTFSHNGTPGESPSPSPPQPAQPTAQARRTSGLMGPKVVVNKPGINVYKGRHAPSITQSPSPSATKPGPEGDLQTNSPSTPTIQKTPSPPTGGKTSNIRPPLVTTDAIGGARYQSRTSIPKRSSSGTRNGLDSPSNSASTSPPSTPATRSTPTGIRVPSRVPRQTILKQ